MRGRVLELKGTDGESDRPGSNPGCGTWNGCYTLCLRCPISKWVAKRYLTGLFCGYIMRHSI